MRHSPSGTVGAEREVGPAPNASGEGDGSATFRKEVLGDGELQEWDGDRRAGLRAGGPVGWMRCAGAGLGIPATPHPAAQSQGHTSSLYSLIHVKQDTFPFE